MTPPAPHSPLSQSELGKTHRQGEAQPDAAALNSSSGARGSHISHNTTVGSGVGGRGPGAAAGEHGSLIPAAADGPASLHVLPLHRQGCGQGHPHGPKHSSAGAQATLFLAKVWQSPGFLAGSVGAFPFSHFGTHIWEGSKAWWPETLF